MVSVILKARLQAGTLTIMLGYPLCSCKFLPFVSIFNMCVYCSIKPPEYLTETLKEQCHENFATL